MNEPGRMPIGILVASKLYIIYQFVDVELLARKRETKMNVSIVDCESILHRVKPTMAKLGVNAVCWLG